MQTGFSLRTCKAICPQATVLEHQKDEVLVSAKINRMPEQRRHSYLQIYLRFPQEVACTSELAGRSSVGFQQ